MTTLNQEELDSEVEVVEPVEGETTNDEQPEEKPTEGESQNIDYHVPEESKPTRTEKEKAEFALKSMAARVKELGGDPSILLGVERDADTSQFVTKTDLVRMEATKLAKSPKEAEAIMAWVSKGLSLEDAHLLANKTRVKSVFSEVERSNVLFQEATGAGQKRPVAASPQPSESQMSMWRVAKMEWDPKTRTAKGKYTETFWNGSSWASRKLK